MSSPGRAVGLFLATVVFGAVAHLAFSDRYVVSSAVVLGADRLGPGPVIEAAQIGGVRSFRLSAAEVVRRVEAHPEIRTAVVTIRLPRQVWIQVEETRPMLTWSTPNGSFLIDENGLAVAGQASGLVTVSDPGGVVPGPGAQLPQGVAEGPGAQLPPGGAQLPPGVVAPGPGAQLPQGVVAAAVALAPQFASLEYRKDVGLVGMTRAGWEVWLGTDADRTVAQTATLSALQARLSQSEVSLVDLRFDRPYYRTLSQGGAP